MIRSLVTYMEDSLLRFIQRRCQHPEDYVAVDILEGSGGSVSVSYCRRCGAVRPNYHLYADGVPRSDWWRLPDPFLWRRLDVRTQHESGAPL